MSNGIPDLDPLIKALKEGVEKLKNSQVELVDGAAPEAFEVNEEIIRLNVGGQQFTAERSTLCQVEGSLLASWFSRGSKDGLTYEDGYVVFNFNPQYFAYILDYLRAKRIASPEKPAPLPKVPENEKKKFHDLVEYLGLRDEFLPADIAHDEK